MATTVTENGAAALVSTGSEVLDYFVRGTIRKVDAGSVARMFRRAWNADRRGLLRAIRNARDCRKGKGERKAAFQAMVCLRALCPKTYRRNMERFFAQDGRFKDLLDVAALLEADTDDAAVLRGSRAGLNPFPELRALATQLARDRLLLASEDPKGVSLAAKWAPSPGDSLDRQRSHAVRVAKILFKGPFAGLPEGWPALATELVGKHGGHARVAYRKEILAPLRAHLRVVERDMSAGRWGDVRFEAVPAKAMKVHRQAFMRHDGERLREFLGRVKTGEAKIKSTGLQPHELVAVYAKGMEYGERSPEEVGVDEVVEAQWKELVAKTKESSDLGRTLGVVDVSGSMSGEPMLVAVALGLLGCLASEEGSAFHRKMVTFDSEPAFVDVKGATLRDMVREVMAMPWGMSTDVVKVFRMILRAATAAQLPQERLPKMVVVYTDMQFNSADQSATRNPRGTADIIADMFSEAGYEAPGLVFWNLRSSKAAFPAPADMPGVALMSGYSEMLLEALLHGDMSPQGCMRRVLEPYEVEIDPEEETLLLEEMADPEEADERSRQ